MSKSDAFENALLNLIFQGTAIAGIAQNNASPSDLFLSLHTADPGEAGTAATNEVTTGAYNSYARKQLARNNTNFTVSGNTAALAANQDFPAMASGTGGSVVAWGLSNSAGLLLYKGTISPAIVLGSGVTPRVNAGTVVTED